MFFFKGKKLFVHGQNVISANTSDELSREFSREFCLPNDVEPSSIKAHLDEKTRELKLTGLVIKESKQNGYAAYASESSTLIGSLKEKKNVSSIDFEIYLGEQLKDGQIIFEVPNLVTLNVRVIKTETDNFGSINLELKREIKLPHGAKLNNINHNIDSSTATLHIQVPLK